MQTRKRRMAKLSVQKQNVGLRKSISFKIFEKGHKIWGEKKSLRETEINYSNCPFAF